MDNTLPWERPEVQLVLSIFNGRVTAINTNNEIKKIGGDKVEIPR